MKQSKLIQLLQGIQHEELRWLAKWVKSPYYNSDQSVIRLFEYMRKYAPTYTSRKLSKSVVFAEIFPNESYNDRRLRVVMFRLCDLIEGFMVAQRLKREPFTYQQHLHAELGERNLYDLFKKKNRDLSQQLAQSPFRDARHYLARWRLEHDHFFHPQTRRYGVSPAQVDEIMQQLDAFFLLSKMRYSAELLNRQNILSEAHEIVLLAKSRELAAAHPLYAEDKVFQVYSDLLSLMEHPDNETTFHRLQENVTQNLSLFRPDDQAMLLRYLINTTIQLYNQGKHEYLNHQFEFYKLGLSYDLFLSDGKLPDATFLNIIVTATTVGELTWGKAFVKEYGSNLPEKRQADAVRLGSAYVDFAQGHFSTSKRLLQQIESHDLHYLLRIKSLSLRNDFELFLQDDSYFELFLYESKAFEKFLQRNEQLSEARLLAYRQFVIFLRKIASLKTNFQLSPQKLEALKAQLAEEPSIIAKQWLGKKLGVLGA